MSEGWGDAKSCNRCGHPSAYHGVTFCMVDTGAEHKRQCDCAGWQARADGSVLPQNAAPHGPGQPETDSGATPRLSAAPDGPHTPESVT